MYYGGEWLPEVDNGKYYMTTYFIGVDIESDGKVACNYAKNYDNTIVLKDGSSYDGYIYNNWCDT